MSAEAVVAELDFVRIDEDLVALAVQAMARAQRLQQKVVTAESCTGGLIATVLSEAPGAVNYFNGAFVTYTIDQKCTALGLDKSFLDEHGAVSEAVAKAMVEGALQACNADVAVSVTGVAGPDPDEKGNPIGLVYIALARRGGHTRVTKYDFGNPGRHRIRYAAAAQALRVLAEI